MESGGTRNDSHAFLEVEILDDAEQEEQHRDARDCMVLRDAVARCRDVAQEVQEGLFLRGVGRQQAEISGGVREDGIGRLHAELGCGIDVQHPHNPACPHEVEVRHVEVVPEVGEVGQGAHYAHSSDQVMELEEAVDAQEHDAHHLQGHLQRVAGVAVHWRPR